MKMTTTTTTTITTTNCIGLYRPFERGRCEGVVQYFCFSNLGSQGAENQRAMALIETTG